MKLKTETIVYLCAAGATSGYLLSRDTASAMQGGNWTALFLRCLVFFAIPLQFAFAYPNLLFNLWSSQKRLIFGVILNGLGAVTTIPLFPYLVPPSPDSPLHRFDGEALLVAFCLALPVFAISGISVILKNRPTLGRLAAVLIWPYWLWLAIFTADRWFYDPPLHKAYYFLCILSPVFFVFAAGALPYWQRFAHSMALIAGLLSLPWIYWSESPNRAIVNAWITFNTAGERERLMGNAFPHAILTILTVGLIVAGIVTSALRLLPTGWKVRTVPLREWNWPAFAISLVALAIWFSQSVLPYRVPIAVDRSGWPIFQVLHVEKRGLQFHETSVSVTKDGTLGISRNGRRLFQYGFQEKFASGELPRDTMDRVLTFVKSAQFKNVVSAPARPLRSWNAEGWYFYVEGSRIQTYSTENNTRPPAEVVNFFQELEALSPNQSAQTERTDVCLGFCYDPPAGLGMLFYNNRCFNDGHGFRCS